MPPTAGSELPQVDGSDRTISLLTSSDVDRAVQAAAETPKRRRLNRAAANVPVVIAVHLASRSKRGLDWHLYSARCVGCLERRVFTRPGLRRCACGAALFIAVGAEVA